VAFYSFFAHASGSDVPSLCIERFDSDAAAQAYAGRLLVTESRYIEVVVFQSERLVGGVNRTDQNAMGRTKAHNEISKLAPVNDPGLGQALATRPAVPAYLPGGLFRRGKPLLGGTIG
jgi:hypothetical protein